MSKYPNKYEIPEQFPEILSNFTREIVRNQPKDILDFAIKYFYNLEKRRCHILRLIQINIVLLILK